MQNLSPWDEGMEEKGGWEERVGRETPEKLTLCLSVCLSLCHTHAHTHSLIPKRLRPEELSRFSPTALRCVTDTQALGVGKCEGENKSLQVSRVTKGDKLLSESPWR